MKRYKGSHSGVVAYECGEDWIKLKFVDGTVYKYDYETPGEQEVEIMKILAARGSDLSTFVSQHVRERYAQKWPAD